MKITKKNLDNMYRCYCASSIEYDDTLHVLLASEEENSLCYAYSGDNFDTKEVVWEHAGGAMSIIPIPTKQKEFLAVQEFYLKVSPSLAKIVWGKRTKHGWEIKTVLNLPYIHRFDIYNKNGVNYFIGATIATEKKDKEDWSTPGCIYVAKLPDDLSLGFEVELLCDGLYRNHGYCRSMIDGNPVGYFGSDQGIIQVTPPNSEDGNWTYQTILEGSIGEVALVDIDNDGEEEIMTIEPFHGNAIHIYKKVNGKYAIVYTYQNEISFAHTLVGTKLCGVNTFLAGVRRKDAELFYVQYIDGEYKSTIIEKGCGPANLEVVHEENRDIIIAANHTSNEAAVYIVESESEEDVKGT